MNIQNIEYFFEELDRHLAVPVRVILTGGAAGILQGVERATYDIDFEIAIKKTRSATWDQVEQAIRKTAQTTGIAPEYAEDIDRWSAIALPSKDSQLYRKIGKVELRFFKPGIWAIGKLTRYLKPDVQDLRTVFKTARTDPKSLARLWGRALGMSPPSSAQHSFRKQVDAFFDQYAREIWGPSVDANKLKLLFMNSAKGRATKRREGRR
jgi:hypothetical protein